MKQLAKMLMMLMLIPYTLQAGIHLEPYLGLQFGNSANGAIEGAIGAGTLVGGRIGFGMLGAFAALDISRSAHEVTTKIGNLSVKTDVDMMEKAIAVGYKIPIFPLKGMLKVIFGHNSKVKNASGDGSDASGMALAAAFTMIPFIDLNLEYKMLKSDEAGDNTESNLVLLSVSAPFNFF